MATHKGIRRSKRDSATFPVLRGLQIGAVTAGVGVALGATPGIAAADDGATTAGSNSPDSNTSVAVNSPSISATPATRTRTRSASSRQGASVATHPANSAASSRRSVDLHRSGGITALDANKTPTSPTKSTPGSSQPVSSPSVVEIPSAATSSGAKADVVFAPTAREITAAAIAVPSPSVAAAWIKNPAYVRLGLPYPTQVTAPVTARSVVTDFLGWIGLGAFAPGLPVPETPANGFLAGLWVGMRRLHYTLHNSYPTLSLVAPTSDPVTGVITGNLGGADADGDVLTYAVSNGSHGTVAIAADGTYTYTPDTAFAHTGGTDTFTASVSDTQNPWHIHAVFGTIIHHLFSGLNWAGVLNPDTKQVTVTIPAGFVNADPVVAAPVLGTPTGLTGAVTGAIAVTDADGDTTAVTAISSPAHGMLNVNQATGAFTYTPDSTARHAASADGASPADLTDTFTLAVVDGFGGTTLVPVTVDVSPANSGPVAVVNTCERDCVGGGGLGSVTASDADGDTLTYAVTGGPSSGSVTIDSETGDFTYTPGSSASQAQVAAVEVAAIQTAAVSDPGVLPSGALGTVTGNTVDTWETYSFTYTPSTTGANFIGFAFRQDPAYWTFDNAQLFETGSAGNLFTNGEFSSGGAVAISTNNGPSSIQAPSNWGVWYQDGTYPAAAGTWDGGSWYDGAVGTFDGIYQGVDLIAGTGYTIRFDVSGNDVANLDDIQLGVYGGTCQDSGSPATSCTVPASSGFATLARPDQTQNAGVTSPSWSADSFEVTVTDGHGGSLVVPVTVAAC